MHIISACFNFWLVAITRLKFDGQIRTSDWLEYLWPSHVTQFSGTRGNDWKKALCPFKISQRPSTFHHLTTQLDTHIMSPLTFSIIRQSTQLSAARRGTVVMTSSASSSPVADNDVTRKEKRVIETPGCFMYSVKGSVPHFTPDTLRLQGFGGVNVSIEQLL